MSVLFFITAVCLILTAQSQSCDKKNECFDQELSLPLKCFGSHSCDSATFTSSGSSLTCSGSFSCANVEYVELNESGSLECSGYRSCDNMTSVACQGASASVDCSAELSCSGIHSIQASSVLCSGSGSCANSVFEPACETASFSVFGYGYAALLNSVLHLEGLDSFEIGFSGPQSGYNVTIFVDKIADATLGGTRTIECNADGCNWLLFLYPDGTNATQDVIEYLESRQTEWIRFLCDDSFEESAFCRRSYVDVLDYELIDMDQISSVLFELGLPPFDDLMDQNEVLNMLTVDVLDLDYQNMSAYYGSNDNDDLLCNGDAYFGNFSDPDVFECGDYKQCNYTDMFVNETSLHTICSTADNGIWTENNGFTANIGTSVDIYHDENLNINVAMRCDGHESCEDVKFIYAKNGGNVYIAGLNALFQAKVDDFYVGTHIETTDKTRGNVYCNAEYSCTQATITIANTVTCLGAGSCWRATISDVNSIYVLQASGFSSGPIVIGVKENMYCKGRCDRADISNVGGVVYAIEKFSMWGSNITNAHSVVGIGQGCLSFTQIHTVRNVYCVGNEGCDFSDLVNVSVVVAQGEDALWYTNIRSGSYPGATLNVILLGNETILSSTDITCFSQAKCILDCRNASRCNLGEVTFYGDGEIVIVTAEGEIRNVNTNNESDEEIKLDAGHVTIIVIAGVGLAAVAAIFIWSKVRAKQRNMKKESDDLSQVNAGDIQKNETIEMAKQKTVPEDSRSSIH